MPPYKLEDYEAVVHHHGDKIYFIFHELRIVGAGASYEAAWADGAEQFERLTSSFRAADAADSIPAPNRRRSVPSAASAPAGYLAFTLKVLIVVAILGGSVAAVSAVGVYTVRSAIERNLGTPGTFSGKAFWRELDRKLADLADHSIQPEKRAEIQNRLRRIVVRIKPFIDELAPLFQGPSTVSSELPKAETPK